MNLQQLARQITDLTTRVDKLQHAPGASETAAASLLPEAFEKLNIALEELRVVEEELRQQNERLLASSEQVETQRRAYLDVLDFIQDGYVLTDRDGLILEVNRAAATMLRVQPRYLIGKPLSTFVEESERRAFRSELARLAEANTPDKITVQTRLQPRRSAPIDVALTVAAAQHAERTTAALRWLLRDITAQKRADERVQTLNAELEQRIAERMAELENEKRQKDEALARERTARMEANTSMARAAFLAEASAILSSESEYAVKLSRLARIIVPFLADWCSIDMLEDDGTVRRLAVAHADPSKSELVRQLQQQYQVIHPGEQAHTILTVLETQKSWIDPEVSETRLVSQARTQDHLKLLQALGFRSEIVVPLVARERAMGAITLVIGPSDRSYSIADLSLAEELARRTAISVDNARLYYEARQAKLAAERAAEHADRLHAASAALSEAITPTQVAQIVIHQGITALNAIGAVLAVPDDGNSALEIVAATDDLAQTLGGQGHIPPGGAGAFSQAAQAREAIWIEAPQIQAGQFSDLKPIFNTVGFSTVAIFPLRAEGNLLGVLLLAFFAPRSFDEADKGFVLSFAQECGHALERAHLYSQIRATAEALARQAMDRTRELQAALLDAQIANRVKNALLSSMNHEMRTPLTSIIGFSNLILSRKPTPKMIFEYATVINNEARRLDELVESFLHLKRIEPEQTPVQYTDVDLAALLEETLESHHAHHNGTHTIQLDLEPTTPVRADSEQLREVVTELLANARKFTPAGGAITVRLKVVDDEVVCSVRDTGIGIPANELDYLFKRFYRCTAARELNIPGVGLGLMLCREIIRSFGGRIWGESAGPGEGATFSFALPAVSRPSTPGA